MIRLTRLRNDSALFLNPDHIERLDHHHDTVVRLFNGTEYVVTETPDEIVELVMMQRARILAVAARLADEVPDDLVERAAVSPAARAAAPASTSSTTSTSTSSSGSAAPSTDDSIWAPVREEG